jgi:hypothetical protein
MILPPLTPAELDMLRHELRGIVLRWHGRNDMAEVLKQLMEREIHVAAWTRGEVK